MITIFQLLAVLVLFASTVYAIHLARHHRADAALWRTHAEETARSAIEFAAASMIAKNITRGQRVIVWAHDTRSDLHRLAEVGECWRHGTVVDVLHDDDDTHGLSVAITFDDGRTVYAAPYAMAVHIAQPVPSA